MKNTILLLCTGALIAALAACAPSSAGGSGNRALEVATLAGGCFWCMEGPFEKLDGVKSVISGYTGGEETDPAYDEVARGNTGHCEAVQITFDPHTISFEELLDVYWRNMDPTDRDGQFRDRGIQYRPGIFFHSDEQRTAAELSMRALAESGRFSEALAVEVTRFVSFFPAEDYHQDFHRTHEEQYAAYRKASGREEFLDRVWGAELHKNPRAATYTRPSSDEIRARLDDLQYHVTQEDGTEPPFKNPYWDNKKAGIYVDIVSGEPLFSSRDKFKSGTGWPSFARPLVDENIVEVGDGRAKLLGAEVRSKHADSHLGHVFADGPKPTGLRFCVNSAALRFIPVKDLQSEGYSEFLDGFEE